VCGAALLALFAIVLPDAARQLAPSPAYLPVVASFTIACDALTAALLLVQATMAARPASAVLGAGYALVAMLWTLTLLAFPDLFVNGTILGNARSAGWLGAFRFSGFALAVMAYLVVGAREGSGTERAARIARRLAVAAVPLAAVLAAVALAVASIPTIPTLVSGGDLRAFISSGVGPSLFVLTFGALALLTFGSDARDPIARWLWVATFAGLVEIAFTLVIQSRFSVGWYVGRGLSFAASLTVLGALCFDVVRLYGELRVSRERSAEQQRETERLAFLAGVAEAIAESLDLDTLLDRLAHRLHPMLGDRVAIVALGGERASVGVASSRDGERDLEATLRGSEAPALLALLGAAEALEHRSVRTNDDARSFGVVVPFADGETVTGAIVASRDRVRGAFSAGEIRLAEDVAARAALGIANVRLYERERRLADSLQRELLPTTLPQLAGLSFDAVHDPGSSEADIGGDWYDAFELPSGMVAFSIGDVAGHGLSAAIVMGRIRQAIRAFALLDSDPRSMVENCDRLLRLENAPMVSAIVGRVDPGARTIEFANAGHPAPIVLSEGHVRAIERPRALPLGLIENERIEIGTFALAPGDVLVLHTDGLIELDRDVELGERKLHAVLESLAGSLAERPAAEILGRMCDKPPRDDIAVLTIAAPADRRAMLDVQLPATPENSRSLRHSFRRVAREAGVDDERAFGLEVAVGEAVANVMEHAYGAAVGTVRLRAYMSGVELLVEVIDYGRWRAPRSEGRGHGMNLMRELSEGKVEFVHDERSTCVRFRVDHLATSVSA
jgi:anti-sigma regulatory factor (Ser/Thr protein kinase)